MNRNRVYRAIRVLVVTAIAASVVVAMAAGSHEHGAHEASSHDVEEHIAKLNQMCGETAEARAARQAETPLYDRLGGYDKISALTTKIIGLHEQNEAIQHLMDGVDGEQLAKHVADFVASGTGGPQKYTGRDMVSAHEHLKLTDADFLSAGGDIVKAMQSFSYGEDEVQEVMCILLSLKDQVVLN
jgi:hemoglobin